MGNPTSLRTICIQHEGKEIRISIYDGILVDEVHEYLQTIFRLADTATIHGLHCGSYIYPLQMICRCASELNLNNMYKLIYDNAENDKLELNQLLASGIESGELMDSTLCTALLEMDHPVLVEAYKVYEKDLDVADFMETAALLEAAILESDDHSWKDWVHSNGTYAQLTENEVERLLGMGVEHENLASVLDAAYDVFVQSDNEEKFVNTLRRVIKLLPSTSILQADPIDLSIEQVYLALATGFLGSEKHLDKYDLSTYVELLQTNNDMLYGAFSVYQQEVNTHTSPIDVWEDFVDTVQRICRKVQRDHVIDQIDPGLLSILCSTTIPWTNDQLTGIFAVLQNAHEFSELAAMIYGAYDVYDTDEDIDDFKDTMTRICTLAIAT